MTAAAKAVADKIDREREREVRNCSILFWTVRFAYEVLPVVMIEILATVLCVRISPSSFLSPTIRLQSMHVLVAERQLRQSAAGQSLATQLNSTRLSNCGLASSLAVRLMQGVWLCLLAHCSTIHLKAGHVQLQLQLFIVVAVAVAATAALLPLLSL